MDQSTAEGGAKGRGFQMISLLACPKCNGAVLEDPLPLADNPLCVNCGWRCPAVPRDVQAEVEAHLGRDTVEQRIPERIGKGEPPMSGWQRTKRRREREAQSLGDIFKDLFRA